MILGWFSLIKQDSAHALTVAAFRRCAELRQTLATTDFILDETASLLKSRGYGHFCGPFFDAVFSSLGVRTEWVDEERFFRTREYFLKHSDHDYSFTDCSSFIIMKELGACEALTKDAHFREAGFRALLA